MGINYKPRKLIPRYTYKVNYKSNIWTITDSFKKISNDAREIQIKCYWMFGIMRV